MINNLELTFNGVRGTAEYSYVDDCWHGLIIDDLVIFEADNYTGIWQAFKDAVVDWQQAKKRGVK